MFLLLALHHAAHLITQHQDNFPEKANSYSWDQVSQREMLSMASIPHDNRHCSSPIHKSLSLLLLPFNSKGQVVLQMKSIWKFLQSHQNRSKISPAQNRTVCLGALNLDQRYLAELLILACHSKQAVSLLHSSLSLPASFPLSSYLHYKLFGASFLSRCLFVQCTAYLSSDK